MLDDITGNFTEPVAFETQPAPPDTPLPPKLCSKGKAFIAVKWNVSLWLSPLSSLLWFLFSLVIFSVK